jgi:Transposase DDE domain group 1
VLRCDPAFKLACGRLPDSERDLCSQPTLSRLENAPSLKDVIRLTYALVDQWMASYARPYTHSDRRNEQLPIWLHQYNWHRPHGGIHAMTPISRLSLSMDNLLTLQSYPFDRIRRRTIHKDLRT